MRSTLKLLREDLRESTTADALSASQLFARKLGRIWRVGGTPRRIGLAISGGVDSMALAMLCREVTGASPDLKQHFGEASEDCTRVPKFMGLIVDHKVRKGSTAEANDVATELERVGVPSRILTLEWAGYNGLFSLNRFESVARTLRYQALGRACREEDLQSLLVGHHADDQAETALMRTVAGYTGAGLRGMSESMPLPECHGMYGVDHSGHARTCTPSMKVEAGGVTVHRLLLHARKAELIRICEQYGVEWFEDHTNSDPTMTPRNAVRSILRGDDVLPKALQFPRLLKLAQSRRDGEDAEIASAKRLLSNMPISLNVRTGRLTFALSDSGERGFVHRHRNTHARALRQLLSAVSPRTTLSLQDLDQAANLVFGTILNKAGEQTTAQVAGVNIEHNRESTGEFILSRVLPPSREIDLAQLQLWPRLPVSDTSYDVGTWTLWDGRYWVDVHAPPSPCRQSRRVVIRFLGKDGYAQLLRMRDTGLDPTYLEEIIVVPQLQRVAKKEVVPSKGISRDDAVNSKRSRKQMTVQIREESKNSADDALRRLKTIAAHNVRLTLPAVFVLCPRSSAKQTLIEQLVALPSLSWYAPGWVGNSSKLAEQPASWLCEIRYKHVDLDEHAFEDSLPGICLGG